MKKGKLSYSDISDETPVVIRKFMVSDSNDFVQFIYIPDHIFIWDRRFEGIPVPEISRVSDYF